MSVAMRRRAGPRDRIRRETREKCGRGPNRFLAPVEAAGDPEGRGDGDDAAGGRCRQPMIGDQIGGQDSPVPKLKIVLGPGTGLGMAIVRDVAEIYNGAVELDESEDMGGLLVRLRLPKAAG